MLLISSISGEKALRQDGSDTENLPSDNSETQISSRNSYFSTMTDKCAPLLLLF